MSYIKNTVGQFLGFLLVNCCGAPVTGAEVTAVRSIDGASQASATGTVTELGGGQYNLEMSQADTNGDDITFLFTATNAVPVEKTITTEDPATSGGDSAVVCYNIYASKTLTAPSWAKKARIGVMGAGGGGAGSNTTTNRASGGGGGAYSEGIYPITGGESIVFTLGSGGAGGVDASGSNGGSSSVAFTAATLTAGGGVGGTKGSGSIAGATGGTASGGQVNSSGGQAGSCSIDSSASGGAGPGHPLGTGSSSGSNSGVKGATGGAGLQGASGSITGGTTSAATGGGGANFASLSISSGTNTVTKGGGTTGTGGQGLFLGVTAAGNASTGYQPNLATGTAPLIDKAFDLTGAASVQNSLSEPGGGIGAQISGSNIDLSPTAALAGGGGGQVAPNTAGCSGGAFGGGGGAVASDGAVAGKGGFGGGGGGAIGSTGNGGAGGNGYGFIVYYG